MPQRERLYRFRESSSQSRVRRLDQYRTNTHAAIGDDAAVIAYQQSLIESLHHLRRDTFVAAIAALALGFGAETQRGQDLDTWSVVAVGFHESDEAVEEPAVLVVIARPRHRQNRQKAVCNQLPDAVQNPLE